VNLQTLIVNWRKLVRKLNYRGMYVEISPKPFPTCIVAGYTRSGTTYIGEILSSVLDAKYVHEPLCPDAVKEVSFFHPRESARAIMEDPKYLNALSQVLGPQYSGRCRGHRFFYRGDRIVKVVRGMFYLHVISDLYPKAKFCVVIRNPASAIASRMRLGFDVPDQSKCVKDIWDDLTPGQRLIWETADSLHERLTLSWCLDNMAAIKNLHRDNFFMLRYEDMILSPHKQLNELLDFLGKEVPEDKLCREISLYCDEAPRDVTRLIKGWEGVLEKSELNEVGNIVDKFDLSFLYDLGTGLPR
jgi:hypothetical protein